MLSSIQRRQNINYSPITVKENQTHYYSFNTGDYSTLNLKNNITGTNDASIINAGMKDTVGEIAGDADLSFNSASSYYMTLPTGEYVGLTGFSIIFWLNLSSSANNSRIYEIGNGVGNNSMELIANTTSGYLDLIIYENAVQYTYSSILPIGNDGRYRHYGISMSPTGTNKYYYNGELYGTTDNNNYPIVLSRLTNNVGRNSNGTNYMNGGISELRIYSTVVGNKTVTDHYLANTRIDNNSNMIMRYKFLPEDLKNATNGITTIYNYVNRQYDASFAKITDNTSIGFTSGKFVGKNCIFSKATTNSDSTVGLRLSPFTTPSTGGYTICFWFKVNASPYTTWLNLFGFNTSNGTSVAAQTTRIGISYNCGGSGTNNPYAVAANGNTVYYFGANVFGGTNDYGTGVWHFCSIVSNYTGSTVTAKFDMTYSPTGSIGGINQNTTFVYNRLGTAPSDTYGGDVSIDDFRFYNIVLTDAELNAIYRKTNKL